MSIDGSRQSRRHSQYAEENRPLCESSANIDVGFYASFSQEQRALIACSGLARAQDAAPKLLCVLMRMDSTATSSSSSPVLSMRWPHIYSYRSNTLD